MKSLSAQAFFAQGDQDQQNHPDQHSENNYDHDNDVNVQQS